MCIRDSMIAEWAPVLTMEQNFVVELFHATTLDNIDFADAIAICPPQQRVGPSDLSVPKLAEPDRSLAEYVQRAMQFIFDFWPTELRSTIERSTAADPLYVTSTLVSGLLANSLTDKALASSPASPSTQRHSTKPPKNSSSAPSPTPRPASRPSSRNSSTTRSVRSRTPRSR